MKNIMTGTYYKGEESYNFNFYTNMNVIDKLNFVNYVVDTLVDDTYYNSIIRDEIFDFMFVKIATNIDVDNFTLDDIEQFLSETNVVDIVKVNMEDGLVDELNKAVSLGIEYKTGIHSNPIGESFASLINTIDKKINAIDLSNLDSVMNIIPEFVKMKDAFTPENVVNAYMNSDLHKKNLDEIEEVKKDKVVDNIVKLEDIKQED